MKRNFIFCVIAIFSCLLPQAACAQIKNISGRILEKTIGNNGKNMPFEEEVRVLAYNTVEAAQKELAMLKQPGAMSVMAMDFDEETTPDSQGYYNIKVASTGAIVVFVSQGVNALEQVNNRLQIDFLIEGSIQLQGIEVTAKSPVVTVEQIPPIDTGSTLECQSIITVPYHTGQENARCVFQPILIDCNTGDTIRFIRPHVYDGTEYNLTQNRRMGYNMQNDVLAPYISKRQLTDKPLQINFQASIHKPDVKHNYTVMAATRVTDYVKDYFQDNTQIVSCQARHPFQFLELNQKDFYELDPEMFKEVPRNELREGAENITLTFPVGKAELDNNPRNEENLQHLQSTLNEISNNPDFTLRNVVIKGYASPEGNYGSNQTLAGRRAETAVKLIGGRVNARYVGVVNPEVVSWSVVADSLEKAGHKDHADQLRTIVYQNPKNMNAQWAQIRNLYWYKDEVDPLLPNLRIFEATWTYQTNRALSPREILDYYYNNPDFREGGPRQFTHYDYWNLFQLVKSPKEAQEQLYRRALRESYQNESRPWVYAGNKVAICDMQKSQWNVETLRPFIDINVQRVNVQRSSAAGRNYYMNLEEVVGNQAITYYQKEETDTAYYMAKMLPNVEKYAPIKHFTSLRALLFKRDKTKAEREELKSAIAYVTATSPVNKAVVEIAQNQNAVAAETIKAIPENDPRRWYFQAILDSRANNVSAAATDLNQCFKLDKSYMLIMQNDGDLTEDVKDTYDAMYNNVM